MTKLSEQIETALKQYQALFNNEDGATEPDISTLQQPSSLPSSQPIITSNRSTAVIHNQANSFGSMDNNNAFAGFDAFGDDSSKTSTNDGFAFNTTNDDPFKGADPFSGHSAFSDSTFDKQEPFATDPFAKEDPFKSDPFSDSDPFKDVTSSNDPFGGSDLFGSPSSTSAPKFTATQALQAEVSSRPKVLLNLGFCISASKLCYVAMFYIFILNIMLLV